MMTDIPSVMRLLVLLLLIALIVILITKHLAVPYTLGLVIVGLLINIFGHIALFHLTPNLVLVVFLPALLFEGSWTISVARVREHWLTIVLLAVPGLLLEVVIIAIPLHFVTGLIWGNAFLLGAILSPTDPVAVLGLFRQLHVDIRLSTIIEAESLFNDGIAGSLYQVFLTLVLVAVHGQHVTLLAFSVQGLATFFIEAGGGVSLGGILGFLISRLVVYIDDPLIEMTVTIVAAYGTYLLADALHISGILAVILVGLVLGEYGRKHGMSERTREAVDDFWNLIAFIANALLFLLVGAQLAPSNVFTFSHATSLLLIAGIVIMLVLLARLILVLVLPCLGAFGRGAHSRPWRFVIFWSGLRGALSLALVLALPVEIPQREILVFSTYAVVFFTLIVQGLSIRFVLKCLPSV